MDEADRTVPVAERSGEFVQSLARGLAVIRAFDADRPELTLSDVARATGLTRAAARRFLHTLIALGYAREDDRYFSLRPRVLELGYSYLSGLGLPEVALPHMETVSAATGESCSMSVLDGSDITYIARVPTRRIMTVGITVGTRFPAYATSMGRVLLAARPADWLAAYLADAPFHPLTERTVADGPGLRRILAAVNRQGWCLVDQELELGLRSVAVPVRDPSGTVVAAMNVSLPARRGTASAVTKDVLPPLLACAAEIEADLALSSPPALPPSRTARRPAAAPSATV